MSSLPDYCKFPPALTLRLSQASLSSLYENMRMAYLLARNRCHSRNPNQRHSRRHQASIQKGGAKVAPRPSPSRLSRTSETHETLPGHQRCILHTLGRDEATRLRRRTPLPHHVRRRRMGGRGSGRRHPPRPPRPSRHKYMEQLLLQLWPVGQPRGEVLERAVRECVCGNDGRGVHGRRRAAGRRVGSTQARLVLGRPGRIEWGDVGLHLCQLCRCHTRCGGGLEVW